MEEQTKLQVHLNEIELEIASQFLGTVQELYLQGLVNELRKYLGG